MEKEAKKRIGCVILALMLACLTLPAYALDVFTFEAKVAPSVQTTVQPPVPGVPEKVYVQTGDRVEKGQILLTMRPDILVAKEPGTVAAVFATPGADGKTVEETYHAAVFLTPARPLYVLASVKGANQTKENTTYAWGETLYIKCTKNGHAGVGRVINIKTWTYTVELLSGDLEDGDSVNLYRDPEYAKKTLVGNGTVKTFELTKMNFDGFCVDTLVKEGDSVRPGDPLLSYAGSTELSAYAKEASIVLSVDAASGAVTLAPVMELCLSAKLSALELSILEAREDITVVQEGTDFSAPGTVSWISGVADENGMYEVRVTCEGSSPRIGTGYLVQAR